MASCGRADLRSGPRWLRAGLAGLASLAMLGAAVACGAAASGASRLQAGGGGSGGGSAGVGPNAGLSSAVSECLRLRDPAAGVAAYTADGARLPFDVFAGHEPGTAPRCRADELRVLRLAALRIDGRLTYVRRGGCLTPCVERQATVHVRAAAFAVRARLLPGSARRGDGAVVANCRTSVRDAPQLAGRQLEQMFYKRPTRAAASRATSPRTGARWSNYGNPGAVYGSGATVRAAYNYVLWNLPRTPHGVLHGGGLVEAAIGQGARIDVCPVAHLVLAAFGVDGRADGSVEFGYGEIHAESGAAIYGWVMLAYTYGGRRQPLTT